MNDIMMWIWWGLTVALCVWKLVEGLFRPQRMLEMPFVAAAMWLYFYGYMAYNAKINLPEYLGNGMANIGQLMPLLSFVGILTGWYLGTRNAARIPRQQGTYAYFNIWLVAMVFLCIGAVGSVIIMRAIRSQDMVSIADESGYQMLFFYVGYPGLAITLWSLIRMPPGGYKYWLWALTIGGLVLFMLPHVAGARRGPLYPAIMILLMIPPIAARRSPNPVVFMGGLAAVGLVMLLFLQVRDVTYNGGSWTEAIHRLDVGAAFTDKAQEADDNEYVNNCQLISTVFQNGKYQYGTGHLGLLRHWIPRAIWKDKPILGEGYYSQDELFDDVEAATGFHLLGFGASSAGVADSFVQYGVFCPVYWMLMSWVLGAVYARARYGDNPRWIFAYMGFICASHWLVSQSLAAATVPCAFFQSVPILMFLIFRPTMPVRRNLAPTRPGPRPTLPEPIVST